MTWDSEFKRLIRDCIEFYFVFFIAVIYCPLCVRMMCWEGMLNIYIHESNYLFSYGKHITFLISLFRKKLCPFIEMTHKNWIQNFKLYLGLGIGPKAPDFASVI